MGGRPDPLVPFTGEGDGFRLSLLGGFRLYQGVNPVALAGGAQRLLAFLGLQGGVIPRPLVAGTLWPVVDDRRSSACLRSELRRLGEARAAVAISNLELGLGAGVHVDYHSALVFAQHLLEPRLEPGEDDMAQAMRLGTDLLPGWYDEWVVGEAERWRQIRLHALESLARRLLAVGRHGEALVAALAAVRADELRESGHALVMKIHLAEGNRCEALRQYRRFRDLLRREMGLEPTPALGALLEDS